jgi:transcriptional regulator with XRE-family HTH domain
MRTRIIEFLKSENKTSAQLAEEIGVQPSGISHILSGRNKPSLDFIIKMIEKYSFLSTDWLLFGKGDMYKEPSLQKLFNESGKPEKSVETTEKPDIRDYESEKSGDNPKNFDLKGKRSATRIQKIVWFFSDNSFREFVPEE